MRKLIFGLLAISSVTFAGQTKNFLPSKDEPIMSWASPVDTYEGV